MLTKSVVVLSIAFFIASQCSPPCTIDGNTPSGCDPSRFQVCGTINAADVGAILIEADERGHCGQEYPKLRDTIAGSDTNTYLVQFDDHDGNCFEILMEGGECWGDHPTNGGNYDCQGRCGGGCGEGKSCSNWARSCLKHDACSWYFGSSGGGTDTHCGDEWGQAAQDYLADCISRDACKGPESSCIVSNAVSVAGFAQIGESPLDLKPINEKDFLVVVSIFGVALLSLVVGIYIGLNMKKSIIVKY